MKLFNTPPLSDLAADAPRPAALPPATPQPQTLRVIPVQKLMTGARWQIEGMRALAEPVFLWLTRGQGRITMGGSTRGYGAHNGIFIPAGVMHQIEFGAQTQGVGLFFGEGSDVTLPHAVHQIRVLDAVSQGEILAIIDHIQRELTSQKIGSERAARHHIGLFSVWLERQIEAAKGDVKRPNAARRLAARYTAALEREFMRGTSVADFAAQLGVTPPHLSRACRESCARSAIDLLTERRHYEACRLLAETEAPIKDIAESLGFTTAAYFTRAFHAKTGKTPSEFRKQL